MSIPVVVARLILCIDVNKSENEIFYSLALCGIILKCLKFGTRV